MPSPLNKKISSSLIFALLASTLAVTGCTAKSTAAPVATVVNDEAITGGQEVADSDALSKSVLLIAMVGSDGSIKGFCSGTIVADDLVVTAAHCVADLVPGDKVFTYMGTFDPQSLDPKRLTAADDFRAHPAYDAATDMNDIALLHLYKPLPADHQVIKILKDRSLLSHGASMVLAGFGPPDDKNPIPLRLRSLNSSLKSIGPETKIIVATTRRGYTDHGDSGGPAFLKTADGLYLVGSDCRFASKIFYSELYEDDSNHLDWLQSAAADMHSKSAL